MKRTSLTLSILLLFAGGVWGAIENDEAIYLACEHGVKKSQDLDKFKPGQHTLDKLLKNEIKLSSIKKLRKLRCWANPCKQYRDDLYIYGMKGLRYHLFKINDETSLGKAKVCRTILHSIQKDDDKEICETWNSDAGEIRKQIGGFYSSESEFWILNRTTLLYSHTRHSRLDRVTRDGYQCYLSSAKGLEQVRNKFEEAKSPIYQVFKEREEQKNLKTEKIKENRKI